MRTRISRLRTFSPIRHHERDHWTSATTAWRSFAEWYTTPAASQASGAWRVPGVNRVPYLAPWLAFSTSARLKSIGSGAIASRNSHASSAMTTCSDPTGRFLFMHRRDAVAALLGGLVSPLVLHLDSVAGERTPAPAFGSIERQVAGRLGVA